MLGWSQSQFKRFGEEKNSRTHAENPATSLGVIPGDLFHLLSLITG